MPDSLPRPSSRLLAVMRDWVASVRRRAAIAQLDPRLRLDIGLPATEPGPETWHMPVESDR